MCFTVIYVWRRFNNLAYMIINYPNDQLSSDNWLSPHKQMFSYQTNGGIWGYWPIG